MRQRYPVQSNPRREYIQPSQIQEQSQRVKQILRQDIHVLQDQNAILKAKCKRLGQLQQKVEMVLRQNNQLLAQNEKMSRLLHQQKSQTQLLRSKHDQQVTSKYGALSQMQMKQKKLLSEIQNLNCEIRQLQRVKNVQVNDIKTQYNIQVQTLKKQYTTSLDSYQIQIRSMKQYIQNRQDQISSLQTRLTHLSSQSQYNYQLSLQQKQKHSSQLHYIQTTHSKSIQDLKHRLDKYYQQQIQRIKRIHNQHSQNQQREIIRLKELIDRVSIQNETVKDQKIGVSQYYQENIQLLKRQIDGLKFQIVDLEKLSENEKRYLEDQLRSIHHKELEQLKYIHNQHTIKLQNQIVSLQNINLSKTNEIQQLIREKINARSLYDNQSYRLKQQILIKQQQLQQLQSMSNMKIKSLQDKIKQKQSEIKYLDKLYKQMKDNSDHQIVSLKELLNQKKTQLEKYKIVYRESEQLSLEEKNTLYNQRQSLKEALMKEEKEKQIQKESLQNMINEKESSLRKKIQSLLEKIQMIEKQNQALKKNVNLKEKQIKGLKQKNFQLEDKNKKLQSEINQNRQKMLNKDKKNNQHLQQQKQRLQKSNNYVLENLKTDHEAALRLQQAKQKQLKDKLAKKQKQLQNLMKMHKKMCDQVKALSQQSSNKNNIDLIKYPGASSDLIANKNIFDVYLKTKLLDLCSDVKENQPQS